MNDNDLERLVNLLSYLKKHDDVEQEIDKDSPKEASPGHAAGRRKHLSSVSPETLAQHTALGTPNVDFDTKKLQEQFRSQTSVGSGTPGTTSGNIPDVSDTSSSQRTYDPEGFHEGPRKGIYFRPGEQEAGGPEVQVISPSDDVSDTPDDTTDDERDLVQWFRDEGYTLAELKQMIEDFTAPATSLPKIKSPQDYERHSVFQRSALFTKSRPKIVRKFNESNILNLFNRLGI